LSTVDKIEVEKFSKLASDWWNPNGKFKPLHLFNPARIKFIKEKLISCLELDPKTQEPLKKINILDIGCGGGLLCEPLKRLGATVTGIDASKKNIKDFGRLSILCNWRLDIKKHFDVSKICFSPKPKINSTVLSFIPKKNNVFNIKNPKYLETVTRVLFSSRRKMINKNFIKLFGHDRSVAKDLNLNLNQRPEELSNEMFYRIAMKYEKLFY